MKKSLFFIAGGLVGAGLALMVAPKTGSETRALIADKVSAYRGGVIPPEAIDAESEPTASPVQNIYQTVSAKVQDAADTVQEAAANAAASVQDVAANAAASVQDAASAVTAKVQDSIPGANKNDELRDKIEAARQRIAAQVVKNAEESVSAAAPVEAEVVAEQPEAVEE